MGAGNSTEAEVLKETITNISVEVMNSISTSASLSTEQHNKLVFSNLKNSTIDGVTQQNTLKANLTAISQSALNGDLQAKMTAAINEQLDQEMGQLQFGSDQKTKVHDIVHNNVNTKITNENLTEIRVNAKQANEIVFANLDSSTATNILQGNEQDLVVKLVSQMSSDIVNDIESDVSLTGMVSQGFASMMDLGMAIFFIGLVVIAVLWMGKDTATQLGKQALQPETILAGTAAFAVIALLYRFVLSDDDDDDDDKKKDP